MRCGQPEPGFAHSFLTWIRSLANYVNELSELDFKVKSLSEREV